MGQLLAKCLGEGEQSQSQQSQRSQHYAQHGSSHSEVLFFPDGALPCRNHMSGHCRYGASCKYSHEETSLVKLLARLRAARSSVDVCVFNITCDDIANALLDLHKGGKQVRIVTDDEQAKSQGSDVRRLAQAGIPVVADNSPFHMHHKFAVIDGKTLLTGSFNWTVQAVTSNQENVVVTDDAALVKAFATCFDKLWRDFRGNQLR